MTYNPSIVIAFFRECGIPKPAMEYVFHPTRKWRFDFCWPNRINPVALEVDGGIWIAGRHSRGASLKKDWEKRNAAAALGWRMIYCEPKDLCTAEVARVVKECLGI